MRTKGLKALTKGLLVALILASLALMTATPAQAFTPRTGDKVVVAAGEVIDDDLYVGANTVVIKGTVKGDLVAAGSLVRIEPTGVIEGDLIAAAQGVVIQGAVEGDVRIAGFTLVVEKGAQVGEDLLAFGYSLDMQPDTGVGQDLVAAAGMIALSGDIGRNVNAAGEGLQIEGRVGGSVYAEVGGGEPVYNPMPFMRTQAGVPDPITVPGGLTIGPEAAIAGSLSYTGPKEGSVAGRVGGQTTFKQQTIAQADGSVAPAAPTAAERLFDWLVGFVRTTAALLLVGLILAYFFPGLLRAGADTIQAQPLPSFAWGVVAYLGFFLLVMLMVLVIIAASIFLGVITLGDLVWTSLGLGALSLVGSTVGFHLAVAYVSKIVVGFLVGRWLLAQIRPELGDNRYWSTIVGVLIFVLLGSIPYVGWVINVFVTLLGLGALFILLRGRYTARPALPLVDDLQAAGV